MSAAAFFLGAVLVLCLCLVFFPDVRVAVKDGLLRAANDTVDAWTGLGNDTYNLSVTNESEAEEVKT